MIHNALSRVALLAVAVMISQSGCKETSTVPSDFTLDPIALHNLGGLSLFFGHQSVGDDILAGVDHLMHDPTVSVIHTRSAGDMIGGTDAILFAHDKIGENRHPARKVTDFAEIMRSGMAEVVDVAMLKFCFVDLYDEGDVDAIAQQYLSTMEILEHEYPQTTFVYLTMPLTSPYRNWKDRVKRILGMYTPGHQGNVDRARFNELIRQAKGSTGRLFDIALVESTRPDGKPQRVSVRGQQYQAMYPGYTRDGGHLSSLGQRIVAVELLRFLSSIGQKNQ